MKNHQKKKIVITGSCGSLGNILKKGLKCYDLSFIDLNENGSKKHFKVNIVKELSKVIDIFKNNDVGIHLAWNIKEDFPKETVDQNNKKMAENIYKAAVKAKIKRLIIASSVHANDYSQLQRKNYDIEYPCPDSPYGASKVYIESLGRYYAKNYNLEIIFIRLGGVNKRDIPLFNEDPNYNKVLLYKKDFIEIIKKCIEVIKIPNNYQIFTAISNNKNKVHQINNFLQWKPKLPTKSI